MADAPMISVTAPEGYKPEEGKPISFQIPVTSIDLKSFAPKEIADKEYFKKITNVDDLFKTLDGAQTALGKPKYGVPPVDAPQEVWDEYVKNSRAPKVDDYAFEPDPNAPAELKSSPEFQAKVKQMFYDAGINPRQATMLQKRYDGLMTEIYKENVAKQAEIDKQFAELTKPIVGDKPDETFAHSKKVLEYLLPKELHPFIGKVNNEGLAVMVALTKAIQTKYMKEDELPKGDGSGGGTTRAELQQKARTLMMDIQKLDPMDPKRTSVQKEIDALYQQISKL